jgi:glycosyltransferase involved in cell wall biosynthesis
LIKVIFQLNSLGFGGTEKSVLTFIENFDPGKIEAYVFFNSDIRSVKYWFVRFMSAFSEHYRSKYQEKYIRNFARIEQFQSALKGRLSIGNGFKAFQKYTERIKPDIVHFNRGLETDFYTEKVDKLSKKFKLVETNIFGKSANQIYLERLALILFSSHWLQQKSSWATGIYTEVLYLPVANLSTSKLRRTRLRELHEIPENAIVLGRLSRPELDNGAFVLETYKKIKRQNSSVILMSLGSSHEFKTVTKEDKSVVHLPPTVNEEDIASFFSAIDIFLHYRTEGETFGLNIAEAMTAGLPVVTHRSEVDNAQIELVSGYGNCGIVAVKPSPDEYAKATLELINSPSQRETLASNSRALSRDLFTPSYLAKKLEQFYEGALKK